MTRNTPVRVPLTEYVWSDTALAESSDRSSVPINDVVALLERASTRLKRTLGLSEPPVRFSGASVMVGDVAGILRLSSRLELEVAPKFLGSGSEHWREDFVLLASLSKSGRFLSRELVGARRGPRRDLASLLARSMVSMFWEHHRRPLQTYNRRVLDEFSFDGEVDLETMFPPEASGFRQEQIVFDRRNRFNATIVAAARTLIGEVRDPSTRRQLQRLSNALAPQDLVRSPRQEKLPARHRHWQELYDLSCQVVSGFGLRLSSGALRAPGYVVNCWRVWEDLLRTATRTGLAGHDVLTQSYPLGTRTVGYGGAGQTSTATVTPDISIEGTSGIQLLVDAKYKSRIHASRTRIIETDLYEALAFLTATKTPRIVLAYPRPAIEGAEADDLGTVAEVERIAVGDNEVIAVEVEVRGISEIGGFRRFSGRLSEYFLSMMESPV